MNTWLSLLQASGGSSEGRPWAAVAGAVTDVLWVPMNRVGQVGVKGEAGLGRFASHGASPLPR